ncbi:MAG: FAD-dependent oxidoreductase [Gemmatimonadales bacterium]|jgi:pyruvate/2-oxoglutarate dehydrogenase complex dihydrolipoamide dehydrogenase (E3) component
MGSSGATDRTYDAVVIGAGAAGLVTASGAALLGARVALIERHRFGGECLWTGCVPSKSLIRTAQLLHDARGAGEVGLVATRIPFDLSHVLSSMRDVIARIEPHDRPETIQKKGVTTIQGTAQILSRKRVAVDGDELATKRIVIATGSRPIIPPVNHLAETGYLTHEGIFALDHLPERLVVLGAGPIGIELAQVFARLGSTVTVIEMTNSILAREDPELAARLRTVLEGEGIRFLLGHKAVAATRTPTGKRITTECSDGTTEEALGDEILVATGMRPFTDSLGLEKVGVEIDDRGAVRVDRTLRTTVRNVWAAGDVTGELFFTHVADYQARTVVRNMFFPFPAKADYSRIPWATFTAPVLARIGLTEPEARDRYGDSIGVHRYDFENLDRAMTDRAASGLVKLITNRRGRIVGGHILGHAADALIHEVALAMRAGMKIGQLSRMVHVYPTWSEGLRRAADSYYTDLFARSRFRPLLRWWVRR